MFRRLALAMLLAASSLGATERLPWFGNDLEFELRSDLTLRWYDRIMTDSGKEEFCSFDTVQHISLAFVPQPEWSLEVEGNFASSKSRSWGIDSIAATGRYLWLDDVLGDPISLATGTTLSIITEEGRKDLSIPHHGTVELETHIAIGKEIPCDEYWNWRFWQIFGLAQGNKGSPRWRSETGVGWNLEDQHRIDFKLRWLYGSGNNDLSYSYLMSSGFDGYQDVHHKSTDLCWTYYWTMGYCGSIYVDYTYRLSSFNNPYDQHSVMMGYYYPFGL